MTDAQIVKGILENNEIVWKHIYRQHRSHFVATLRSRILAPMLVEQDWEDIFHDSCIVLMEKVKAGKYESVREGGLFSYMVEIGKGLTMNLMRKKRNHDQKQEDAIAHNLHREDNDFDVTVEEKQQSQNEFLDRVFDSIPGDCQMMLKKFYWDHKPMDEIASMMGLRNADTAKTKKNRCMNKFKEIAAMLLESDEFAEEVVRASVERAALRELLKEESIMMNDKSIRRAALDLDTEGTEITEDTKGTEDQEGK